MSRKPVGQERAQEVPGDSSDSEHLHSILELTKTRVHFKYLAHRLGSRGQGSEW